MLHRQNSKLPSYTNCHSDSKSESLSYTSPFDPNMQEAHAQTPSLNLHASVHKGQNSNLSVSGLLSKSRKIIQKQGQFVIFAPTVTSIFTITTNI